MSEKLISNPSKLSEKLNKIVLKHNTFYQKKLKSKNPFYRLQILVKISLYQKLNHPQFFYELRKIEYEIDNFSQLKKGFFKENIQFLLDRFSLIQKKLIFHNLSLVFFYKLHPRIINSNSVKGIFTIEQEKNLYLQKFAENKINKETFDQKFGHYAINAYELESKRFNEYSVSELKRIASLLTNLKIRSNNSSSKIYENPIFSKEVYSNYLVIREYAKYVSLKIIALLRKIILEQSKNKSFSDPFGKNWSDFY